MIERGSEELAAAMLAIPSMPESDAATMQRLHGTSRGPRSPAAADDSGDDARPPWWDPAADASMSPETDAVVVAGHQVSRGSRMKTSAALLCAGRWQRCCWQLPPQPWCSPPSAGGAILTMWLRPSTNATLR